ncbi:hypothetical protein KFL_000610330 [Klebsormidium nitens]|uniref:Choline transporter-like protein n=1 Tax=Klebsormidium nitens TaxID=105231 RepID=A0A0U9HKL4_KLENI|nr:hypothetical protein KFL_000610330 [Klebsormidium nitens]|eukprot:GAQ80755.1 hypothetical protein KFL_000610330 [Klebsormidium nitens]
MSLPTPFATPYNSNFSDDAETGHAGTAPAAAFDSEEVPLSPRALPHRASNATRPELTLAGGDAKRPFRDVLWAGLFLGHLGLIGWALVVWGKMRFDGPDRHSQTTTYWPQYGGAAGLGIVLTWAWLWLFRRCSADMIKMSVHSVSTFGAVLSVLLFWNHSPLWGIGFAAGAAVAFVFSFTVTDRLPFTALVIQKAVDLVGDFPSTLYVAFLVGVVSLAWLALWTFGAAGTIALSSEKHRWAKLFLLSVSLLWTAVVAHNVVHVAAACAFAQWFLAGGEGQPPEHRSSRGLVVALTSSFGSVCFGSLLSPPVRTLRWLARGLRGRMRSNECMLCCLDCYLGLLEGFVRIFNKYAYVHMAIGGKGFNRASTDAWERFQLTGVEALVAQDLSGAVLLLSVALGGLITGTVVGTWVHYTQEDRTVPVAVTGALLSMMLIGLVTAVIEAGVTTIYVMFAEDPALISRWDPEFGSELEAMLNERLARRARKPLIDNPRNQP